MTCENREKDILLLAHGELDPWRRLFLETHLRRCASCRRTLKEMRSVSGVLGSVLCDPALPAWSAEGSSGFGGGSSAPWSPMTRLLVIAALIIALFIVGFTIRGVQATHGPHVAPSAGGQNADLPCRPGLPHDRCR